MLRSSADGGWKIGVSHLSPHYVATLVRAALGLLCELMRRLLFLRSDGIAGRFVWRGRKNQSGSDKIR